MIRTNRSILGMPLAAMPLLRMQSQITTLDLLNRISEPPCCEITQGLDENGRAMSSALAVVLQISSQLLDSYLGLVHWTVQKPSYAITEITSSGHESETRATKSR